MFDIEFIADQAEPQEEGWSGLPGRIRLGGHSERFLASLSIWSRTDYERHWVEAARRLLSDEGRAGFFTNAFQFWWVMWRDGAEVFVREVYLTPEHLVELGPQPDVRKTPYQLIGPRETDELDGPVSEWRVNAADVSAFLERRTQQQRPLVAP